MSNDTADDDLGSCCCCGRATPVARVRNILMLDREAPEGFNGWGCFVCGLPARGAIAVVCDECVNLDKEITHVCGGKYPKDRVRIPVEQLTEHSFKHDEAKHAGEE